MRDALHAGQTRAVIEAGASQTLKTAGLTPEYAVLRRTGDLTEPGASEHEKLIALVAARLGSARLIDNLVTDP